MSNLEALDALIADTPSILPAQAALARSLASAIDAAPEVGLAALAKEYRALLKDLTSDAGAAPSLDDLFAEMGD